MNARAIGTTCANGCAKTGKVTSAAAAAAAAVAGCEARLRSHCASAAFASALEETCGELGERIDATAAAVATKAEK